MKIKNLLRQHSEAHAESHLPHNLGDAYLIQHNQIYREVRLFCLRKGFRYSDQYDEAYATLPLSQLDNLLANKTIPYQNNVSVLEDIERKAPGQIEWDHICDNLKQNHVFHESCHAIARTLAQEKKIYSTIQDNKNNKIALILLEESFANTCELLAVADVHDAAHRIFFETNSYICMFEDKTHLKNAIVQFGRENFFKFILLCYYHANFLNDKMTEQDFLRLSHLAFGAKFKPQPPESKTLKALAKNAFALNPRFRFTTTSFYLRMNGIEQEIRKALQFDHLKIVEENPAMQKMLEASSRFTQEA